MRPFTGKKEIITLVFAFIISFILWVYANLSQNPEIVKVIEIVPEYKNIPGELKIGKLRDTISLYVTGKRINLIKSINTGLNLYRVTYDLSNLQAGENKVKPIINEMFSLNFKVIRTEPETLSVNAQIIVEKEMLVTNTITGEPRKGFYMKEFYSTPPTVIVKGLESDVDRVFRVEGSKRIDINDLSENKVLSFKLNAFNSKQEVIKNVKLTPSEAKCIVKIDKFKKKRIPVLLKLQNKVSRGYNLQKAELIPESVELYGPEDKLENAPPFHVNVSLDGHKRDVVIRKKIFCKENDKFYFSDYKKSFTCKIKLDITENIAEKKFFKLPLNSLFNQKKGFVYRIDIPDSVDVRISGPELIVEKVFSTEVIPYVDVKDVKTGDWTLTVETMLPSGVDLIRMYPNNAKVTIVENKQDEGKKE